MNSEPSTPTPLNVSNPPSTQDTQLSALSQNSSPDVTSDASPSLSTVDFKEAPLEFLLSLSDQVLVHEMTSEQLLHYIQRCALLRASAQTRKAALTKETGSEPKKKTAKKKDSVDLAMELFNQIK